MLALANYNFSFRRLATNVGTQQRKPNITRGLRTRIYLEYCQITMTYLIAVLIIHDVCGIFGMFLVISVFHKDVVIVFLTEEK